MQFRLLTPTAFAPERSSSMAAGYDLFFPKSITCPAERCTVVDLELSVEMPPGVMCLLIKRSGAAIAKPTLQIHTGTIGKAEAVHFWG